MYSPSTSLPNLPQTYPTPEPEMVPSTCQPQPWQRGTLFASASSHPGQAVRVSGLISHHLHGDRPYKQRPWKPAHLPAKPGQRGCDQFFDGRIPARQPGDHFRPGRATISRQGQCNTDASNAGVILDGSQMPSDHCCGIIIHSNGNVVRGLQVLHFPSIGIHVYGEYNLIGGSRLVGNGPVGQGNIFRTITMLVLA